MDDAWAHRMEEGLPAVCVVCSKPADPDRTRLRIGYWNIPLCGECITHHIMVDTYCTDCRSKTVYAVAEKQPTCCVCANRPKPEPPVQEVEPQTSTTPELADLKHKKR